MKHWRKGVCFQSFDLSCKAHCYLWSACNNNIIIGLFEDYEVISRAGFYQASQIHLSVFWINDISACFHINSIMYTVLCLESVINYNMSITMKFDRKRVSLAFFYNNALYTILLYIYIIYICVKFSIKCIFFCAFLRFNII